MYWGGNQVILDHCTMTWSSDETFSNGANNVTLQYCILAEGFQGHSTGGIVKKGVSNIDYHHNLIMSHNHRQFMGSPVSYRFINNIVYNWRLAPSHHWMTTDENGGVSYHDFIGNVFKTGPVTAGMDSSHKYSIGLTTDDTFDSRDSTNTTVMADDPLYAGAQVLVYASDNYNSLYGKNQTTQVRVLGKWQNGPAMEKYRSGDWSYPDSLRRSSPLAGSGPPIGIDSTGADGQALLDVLLPEVGVCRGLNADGQWESRRDELDARLVSECQNGAGINTGGIVSVENVGGFPQIADGTEYPCTANDGISDAWKTRNGLDINTDYSSTEVPGLAGWTYLDLFLAAFDVPT